MTRPPQPLDASREGRLVAAAARAFTDVGYELASLNAITAEAGWAKSSFYHYFPDKQRLHDHVVATLRAAAARRVVPADLSLVDSRDYWPEVSRVLALLMIAVADDEDARMLARMFTQPLAARGPTGSLTRLRGDVRDWLGDWLRHGQGLGLVRRDLPLDLLRDMVSGTVSGALQWVAETGQVSDGEPDRVADALRGLVGVTAARS
ncbi:MAG TPA: TetR/AcrR family transcriptional regulator [Propionibacteriaceae bacterium]|nr:TetR/AcrR family transcriptional regulator [Propionibacteriaceae bacterium]